MSLNFGAFLRKAWGQPLAHGIDLNGPDAVLAHRRIIDSNRVLRAHYMRWYRECLPAVEETRHLTGDIVEIGSGAGFLDQVIPKLVKTDSVQNQLSHRVVDAMKLPFADSSLRALFLIGVLHHIPHPAKFLSEAQRCLRPGGRLVMLEPHNSWPQRFLCRLLEHYEYFDDAVKEWTNEGSGRMTQANMALPWVIFIRDRARFEKEFPALKILRIRYHTLLSYILSGGMSFRPFIPAMALPLVATVECAARPLMRWAGTMMTIDVEKK